MIMVSESEHAYLRARDRLLTEIVALAESAPPGWERDPDVRAAREHLLALGRKISAAGAIVGVRQSAGEVTR